MINSRAIYRYSLSPIAITTLMLGATTSSGYHAAPSEELIVAAEIQNNLTSKSTMVANGGSGILEGMDVPERFNSSEVAPELGTAVENIYELESSPGSPVTFYLDFDGAVLSGTSWNNRTEESEQIEVSAFSLDGDPSQLTNEEKAAMYLTWDKVSQTFAQFDVNVTTVAPSVEQMIRSDKEDTEFGVHVIFTEHELPIGDDCECNGIARSGAALEIGEKAVPAPAFVNPDFTTQKKSERSSWGKYDFSDIDTAAFVLSHIAIHEIGHTLGLKHDGMGDEHEYATTLGALSFYMGRTPHRDGGIARWSDGSHMTVFESMSGSQVNYEDDLAYLETILPVRPDDYVDNALDLEDYSASTIWNESQEFEGILTNHTDRDWIKINILHPSIVSFVAKPTINNHQLAASLYIVDERFDKIEKGVSGYSNSWEPRDTPETKTISWARSRAGMKVYALLEPGHYYVRVSASDGDPVGALSVPIYGSLGPWQMIVTAYEYPIETYEGTRLQLPMEFMKAKNQYTQAE